MPWYKAFTIKPFAEDEFITELKIEGKQICFVKSGDKIFAFQNKCPHAGGMLCNGWLDEGMIVCPNHHHKYNMETGQGQGMQGDYVNIYETKRIADEVHIKVRSSLNPFRWLMNLFN